MSGLLTSVGALAPAFSPATLAYAVGPALLPGSTTVTATTTDPTATIQVNGQPTASGTPSVPIVLPPGVTPITIVVTAADGVTQQTTTLVFQRQLTAQEAYAKASNTGAGDLLGASIALSGDTLVVGAPAEASNATGVNGNQADDSLADAGAVYVYVRNGGGWTQQAYLKASNTGVDRFGHSVAIDGDTLAVGALVEASSASGVGGNQLDDGAPDSGAVYVFVRTAGAWTQQAYVKASNTSAGDQFGHSVALSGNTLAVGARREDSSAPGVNGNQNDESLPDSGAAYVFVRSGTTWTQQAYLKASNPGSLDEFGYAVAVAGDTLLVGAEYEDSNATGVDGNGADDSVAESGAAYVFVRTAGVWSQQGYLKASNTGANDQFGFSVALSGETLAVGARREGSRSTGVDGNQTNDGAPGSGAVYLFQRFAGTWVPQAYVKASNPEPLDEFGYALALSGDTLVVGAIGEDGAALGLNGNASDNGAADAGAAYVFLRTAGTWAQHAYVKASNTNASDRFGFCVAVSGDTLTCAAPSEDSNATGVGGTQTDNSSVESGAAYVLR